ncbi:MAG: hypothetical protein FOGNACKC_00858 [Anaerolineae bacterium]|nr:hypothetical protein [Anaerolineae bacterium]
MLCCIAVIEFPNMDRNEMELGEIATWIQGALMRDGDRVNVTVFPGQLDLLDPILKDTEAYQMGRLDAEEFSMAENPFDPQTNYLEFVARNVGHREALSKGA